MNEALKAMGVFSAVKRQMRPFTKTARRRRFARTQLVSTKETRIQLQPCWGKPTGLRKNLFWI